ncbi:MAG: NACHT domain-containing protein, partial [Anaerolineae bacterium]|nr:NACHT domain-containing protein [Anaerolineae bacterium]
RAGFLSLTGIDPKLASSSEADARLSLSAVYTALLTHTSDKSGQIKLLPERGEERLSALDQLNRHPRLVLLGDPGSGKSTFVNFVALCLAGEMLAHPQMNLTLLTEPLPKDDGKETDERQPWDHPPLLPVPVVLRDFAARGLPPVGEKATAKHLYDFIVADLHSGALAAYAKPLTRTLLHEGGLLLLDGLDEVPEAQQRRVQIKQAVTDFAATFKRCRILVTSRTYAYQQQAWRLPGFTETVLAPFSRGQIGRFVERWYAHMVHVRGLAETDAQGRAELLKRAIFGSDRLRGLAERP